MRVLLIGSLLVGFVASFSATVGPPRTQRSAEAAQDELETFHKWADDHGIERKVKIQQDTTAGGGRGLIATQRIEPGEEVVKVPLDATLRLEHTPELDLDDNWAGILSRILHQEFLSGSCSPFAPYVANLPKEAPLTPCRWNSAQRHQLHNDTFVQMIHENSQWRKRQLTNQNVDHLHVVDYMKYLDLVCSRTLKGCDGSRQLVPLIDIANHAPSEAGGGRFVVDREAVYLLAGCRGIQEGQAVTLDYGARTVDDFLLHYGFVPHRCVSDSVSVNVGDAEVVSICWSDIRGYRGHDREDIRQACARLLDSSATSLEEDAALMNSMSLRDEADQSALSYRYAKKSLLASAAGIQGGGAQSAFTFR